MSAPLPLASVSSISHCWHHHRRDAMNEPSLLPVFLCVPYYYYSGNCTKQSPYSFRLDMSATVPRGPTGSESRRGGGAACSSPAPSALERACAFCEGADATRASAVTQDADNSGLEGADLEAARDARGSDESGEFEAFSSDSNSDSECGSSNESSFVNPEPLPVCLDDSDVELDGPPSSGSAGRVTVMDVRNAFEVPLRLSLRACTCAPVL